MSESAPFSLRPELNQADLKRISGAGTKPALLKWLRRERIPFTYDAKGRVLTSVQAFEEHFGSNQEREVIEFGP